MVAAKTGKQKVSEDKKKKQVSRPSGGASKDRGISSLLSGTRAEMQKVSWPDRNTVLRASLVIVIVVVVSTLFVAGADVVFSKTLLVLRGL